MRRLSILVLSATAFFCQLQLCTAQVAPPNEAGISMGHIHLQVADLEAHKKLWVGVLGGQEMHAGPLYLVRFPGIFVIIGQPRTPPSDGSDGSTVHHVGFAVKNLADIKAKLTAANIAFSPENARMAIFPDKVLVEFTEDTSLKVPIAFHHIHIASVDQEKLRSWYVKTFGGTAGTRGNFLGAMFPGGEVDFRKAQDPQAPTKGRSLDHIGFEVHGLEAFCKKLQADGMNFDMSYRDVPQIGLKIAFILDPEGTRIELTEGLAGRE